MSKAEILEEELKHVLRNLEQRRAVFGSSLALDDDELCVYIVMALEKAGECDE